MSQSKRRLLELNARLAQNLTDKGVETTADETTTTLVDKVVDIPSPKEEQEKTVSITENGTTEILPDEGKALSKVTVNVDVKGEEFIGIKYSEFDPKTGRPTVADARALEGTVSGMHSASYLFANISNNYNGGYNSALKTVYLPSGYKELYSTFLNCFDLENIYGDLSLVNSLNATFKNCASLKELPYMPSVGGMGANTCAGCVSLEKVTFYVNGSLQMNSLSGCSSLTEVNIPQDWNGNMHVQYSPNLTQASLHKIIENYADMTGQTSPMMNVGSVNLEKIDDEHKAMAAAKNITLA